MQDFIHNLIPFVIKYWYLVALFVISLALLIVEEARSKGMFSQISPQQAIQLINRKQAIVIDIRDKNAFKQGHIINAINVPEAELKRQPEKLDSYKAKELIIICANGQASGTLEVQLRKQNFSHVVSVSGGMRAWQQEQMPTTIK